MNILDRGRLRKLNLESLRRCEMRIRLAGRICNTCLLKSLCYYSRYEWEKLDDFEFVEIVKNCPLRSEPAPGSTNS